MFQTQLSTHSEPGGGQMDITGPDNARFDSTNMFHWCPAQPLSTCLLVSGFAGLAFCKDELNGARAYGELHQIY